MPTTHIYTLSDPRTGDVRYVGKTRDAKARIRNHLNKREHSHKGNWIESLRKLNLEPEVCFIDEVPTEDWSFWEQYWIQTFLGWGFPLTNMNAGGGEHARFTPELKTKHRASFTEEVRKVMHEKAIASMGNPIVKAKHVLATQVAMKQPEVKAKMQKKSDPANAARAEKVRANWADPEFKEKQRQRMIVANANPEVIAKRSAAAKRQYGDVGFATVLAAAHAATRKSVTLSSIKETKVFNSLAEAAGFLEVHQSVVGRTLSGKRKSDTINGWKIVQ